ncbi:MAG TPA: hypothetical protein ENF75_05405 [Acidilobales archaeon]|nr:hypothetical protein [Acidilobales archaeon]
MVLLDILEAPEMLLNDDDFWDVVYRDIGKVKKYSKLLKEISALLKDVDLSTSLLILRVSMILAIKDREDEFIDILKEVIKEKKRSRLGVSQYM